MARLAIIFYNDTICRHLYFIIAQVGIYYTALHYTILYCTYCTVFYKVPGSIYLWLNNLGEHSIKISSFKEGVSGFPLGELRWFRIVGTKLLAVKGNFKVILMTKKQVCLLLLKFLL